MKLIALLSWYDEPVGWLVELVGTLAKAGVDELVAIDGAYQLFPYARPHSNTDQAHVLLAACAAAGVGLTLRQPNEVWAGNEMEKRSALFAYGHQIAAPGIDWFWVMDGDELVTQAPKLREQLEATELEAGEALCWWSDPEGVNTHADGDKGYKWVRKLFRAQAFGIRLERNHWTYVTGDGRFLWGLDRERVPCVRLWNLEIEHRLFQRPEARREYQHQYYRERAEHEIEVEGWPVG